MILRPTATGVKSGRPLAATDKAAARAELQASLGRAATGSGPEREEEREV